MWLEKKNYEHENESKLSTNHHHVQEIFAS